MGIRGSDTAVLLARVSPVSQGVGAVSTAWIPMADLQSITATVLAGVLGAAATLDAKLEQATSAAGAGAKDVTGKAITQLVKATDDNKEAVINCRAEELDVEGGFAFARLTLTVGGAASLVAGTLHGFYARYQPDTAATTVAQVVG